MGMLCQQMTQSLKIVIEERMAWRGKWRFSSSLLLSSLESSDTTVCEL